MHFEDFNAITRQKVSQFLDSGTYKKRKFWLILLAIILVIFVLRWILDSLEKSKKPALPVVVAAAKVIDVPVYLTGLGTVIPTRTITLKTQVNGQLIRVLFREGQMVKAGELLAEIDPRPYQAQLTQYEGQLARDQALLANALIDLKRYELLWHQDSVAKQTFDTQAALVRQYQGTIKIDQGLLEATRVNLIYTHITSPINGRIGIRLVDPGNFVQTSDTTGLAIINMLDPITVIFTLPEDNIPDLLREKHLNKNLLVNAYNRDRSKLLAIGSLLTVDNQIDPTTGTIKLKAQFANKNNQLFPNQFVNIELLLKILHNAITIPTAAIQYDAQGPFVFVLNKDNTVKVKSIVTNVAFNGDTVITSGLTAGEIVVVEGTDKLIQGTLVTTTTKRGVNVL